MTCEELRDHYELFVLGVAEDAEAGEIRAHLKRNCDVCAAGVKGARELTALLSATAPTASPRPELRRRIMASVAPPPPVVLEKRGFRWAPVWAAVAGLAALTAVYFEVRVRQEMDQSAQLRAELNRQAAEAAQRTAQLSRLNDALAIVNSTEAVEVTFGPKQQPSPAGKVFVSPQRGVLFIASRLPAAPAGKIYEMWIVPKRGAPAPAGLFQSGADGVALHLQPGPVDLNAAGAVAVTLENAGGATAPTPPILIAAALPPR
ncbi:MAG TPA: anti-sigma factor [Bryobacteraceae bacterium]|nr:anti-sigma factor [Bryobacteraceae bacterium]